MPGELHRLVNDPELWRGRAEAARATAEQMTSIEARETMFRIAEHYDWLARCAEKGPLKELNGAGQHRLVSYRPKEQTGRSRR